MAEQGGPGHEARRRRRRRSLTHGEPILLSSSRSTSRPMRRAARPMSISTHIRPDLAEVIARQANTLDANRPGGRSSAAATPASAPRARTSRISCDDGSFVEYGALAVAAQRRRRKLDDLIANTPADGLVMGIATVNGAQFGPEARALHGAGLRLHGARRHAGPHEPQEDGPHADAGGTVARAARVLRRGRRRPARRHRPARRDRPRRADLRAVREAVRPRAAGRHRLRPLLRRQRRDCSAAATSSSPPRTPSSAWAARP